MSRKFMFVKMDNKLRTLYVEFYIHLCLLW